MTLSLKTFFPALALGAIILAGAQQTVAQPQHGIAMYGDPALPPDFVSLPYANPDAPQGGRIVFGEQGGFDSLNPYILKGRAPWGVRAHMVESLMGWNWNEPFSLYGLLAESVETDEARTWVEFTLRPEAHFSDGSPVTAEDVLWSFRTLGTIGHPRYVNAWKKVASAEQTGPRTVRFTFNQTDRELPLILGLRPVLQKAQFEDRPFDESSLDPLIGSGPYVIEDFEPGRFITFKKDPNYWGNDLPLMRGQNNITRIRYDYFADKGVIFEAFKAGEIDAYREGNALKWAKNYDFAAVTDGRIVKDEIPHQRPTGMTGLVMNTRKPLFADWRVREALIQAFNYEFINKTLNGGAQPRIGSYFSNSVLGLRPGPADGAVAQMLAPFNADLLPGTVDGYALPVARDDRNRTGLRNATKLLKQAGWQTRGGKLVNAAGEPFEFEVLLRNGAREQEAIVNIFASALERLGIRLKIAQVDNVEYKARLKDYDYDMTWYRRYLSLSPGNEQTLYWGRAGVTEPGTRNYMGMSSDAAEAMIATLLAARSQDEFIAATRALDRILTAGRYVIPIWYDPVSRLAHRATLHYPDTLPIYGDWVGFMPEVWWDEAPG